MLILDVKVFECNFEIAKIYYMFYVVFSNIKYNKVYHKIVAGLVFIDIPLFLTEIINQKC